MQNSGYQHLIIFVSLSLLTACTGSKEQKQQEDIRALEKEVIAIHDEVMPKMSDIARLLSILEIDEENSSIDSLTHKDISESIAELNMGDSLMWEWMHNYRKPEDAPLDSIEAYLQSEITRVTKVRDVMLEGIKNAEALVQKLDHDRQK
jgi:hypothetical protein